jgi:hypothetical protein
MKSEGSLPWSQDPAPILNHMHPVHTFPPYFAEEQSMFQIL